MELALRPCITGNLVKRGEKQGTQKKEMEDVFFKISAPFPVRAQDDWLRPQKVENLLCLRLTKYEENPDPSPLDKEKVIPFNAGNQCNRSVLPNTAHRKFSKTQNRTPGWKTWSAAPCEGSFLSGTPQ